MTAPGTNLFQRASTGRFPHPPLAGPHNSHVAGAGVGTLHLTSAEEEAIAAYVERVWQGATGISEVPPRETLCVLVGLIMRKARGVVAIRDALDHQPSQGM